MHLQLELFEELPPSMPSGIEWEIVPWKFDLNVYGDLLQECRECLVVADFARLPDYLVNRPSYGN